MSNNTQKINITLNTGNFFDGWDMNEGNNAGLKEDESINNFAELLKEKLQAYYPEAEITVDTQNTVAAKTYTVDVENLSDSQEDEINNDIVHLMNQIANISERWTVFEN